MSEIRPLGDRILVKADARPPASEIIALTDDHGAEMSGTVVALGDGSLKLAEAKRNWMRDIKSIVAQVADTFRAEDSAMFAMLADELGRYGAMRPCDYDVKVGDHLLFPWNIGTKVEYEGESYILMTEDDPIAILEDELEQAS